MPTYLDMLPDDPYIKIFEQVNRNTLKDAALLGNRRNIPKQGVKTNHMVIWNWMNGRPFKSLRMSTDGKDMYSYNLKIGHTDDNKKVLHDFTAGGLGYCSHTTSHHVNLARVHADSVICKEETFQEWLNKFIMK